MCAGAALYRIDLARTNVTMLRLAKGHHTMTSKDYCRV